MRIKEREQLDGEEERVTVVPDNVDDLWHLQYVVEPEDIVSGDTTRRIRRDDEDLRDTGGEREHLWVAIEVEEVEFHRFANRLRISGVISDCSREDQIGHHHTLNVEVHDEVTIEKLFKPDQRERLEDAEEAADTPDVVIATVEEGEAYVYTVEQYGTEERGRFTGTTGKGEYARSRAELFAELTDALRRMDPDAIVLAGPGFTKQDAMDYIEENTADLASRVTTVDTSAGGDRGVHEALKRGVIEEIQEETRIAREAELLDKLTERIAEGTKVAYGPMEVEKAAEYGAVETLLVVDDRLRKEREAEGDWNIDVNSVVTAVEQQGGEVVVFSGEFNPGQQLSNLGGVAALLRYRLE